MITDILNSKSRVLFDDDIGWVKFQDIVNQAKLMYKDHKIVISRAKTPYEFLIDLVGAISNDIPIYQWMREAECIPQYSGNFKLISYTSGTTGYPQEVVQSPDVIYQAGHWYKDVIGEFGGPFYSVLPQTTSSVTSICFLPSLIANNDIIIKPFNKFTWLDDIEKHSAYMTVIVAVMARLLKTSKNFDRLENFTSLKRIGMGANILPTGSFDLFKSKGVIPCNIYGSTEVLGCCFSGFEENWFDVKPKDVDWHVKDNILQLKWKSQDEFWHSNDIVEVDNMNRWRIIGRSTTRFKYRDMLISPEQYESLAKSVTGVNEAVLSMVDDYLVLFYEGEDGLEKEIMDSIQPMVITSFEPDRIKKVEKIPLNHLGKISRSEVKNLK